LLLLKASSTLTRQFNDGGLAKKFGARKESL